VLLRPIVLPTLSRYVASDAGFEEYRAVAAAADLCKGLGGHEAALAW